MRSSSRAALDAPHEAGADLPRAQHAQEAPAAQDMALSSERCCDRASEPGLVRRYHLHSDAAWLPLSCGDHGLVPSQGACLAAVQQQGCRLLRRRFERGIGKTWPAGDLQHRQSYDWNQFSGGLTQTPIDRSLGWCPMAHRCDLTVTPIDLMCLSLDLSIIRERSAASLSQRCCCDPRRA